MNAVPGGGSRRPVRAAGAFPNCALTVNSPPPIVRALRRGLRRRAPGSRSGRAARERLRDGCLSKRTAEEGGCRAHEVCRVESGRTPSGDHRSSRGRIRRRRPGSARANGGAGPVTNYLTYVGGKAGKANPKLSPVVIGAVNTQGGQVLIGPNWTKGAELAVKYVNTYLGGVQGHPSSSANASRPRPRKTGRSAARSSRTTSASPSSSWARSPSATSRSTRRSAVRSRSSAASRCCPSTRRRRTSSRCSGRTTRCSARGARSRRPSSTRRRRR